MRDNQIPDQRRPTLSMTIQESTSRNPSLSFKDFFSFHFLENLNCFRHSAEYTGSISDMCMLIGAEDFFANIPLTGTTVHNLKLEPT